MLIPGDVIVLERAMTAFSNGNATPAILTFESVASSDQVPLKQHARHATTSDVVVDDNGLTPVKDGNDWGHPACSSQHVFLEHYFAAIANADGDELILETFIFGHKGLGLLTYPDADGFVVFKPVTMDVVRGGF